MRLVWNKPDKRDYRKLMNEYYEQSELLYGKSIFKDFSQRHINSGKTKNPLLLLDHNYALASFNVDDLYTDNNWNFVGLYADNGTLIAHTKCYVPDDFKDKIISCDPIIVDGKEEFEGFSIGDTNLLFRIYDEFVKFIINYIQKFSAFHEYIIFNVDPSDTTFISILEVNGFKATRKDDIEVRYVYELFERKENNERCNTTRQRTKQDK